RPPRQTHRHDGDRPRRLRGRLCARQGYPAADCRGYLHRGHPAHALCRPPADGQHAPPRYRKGKAVSAVSAKAEEPVSAVPVDAARQETPAQTPTATPPAPPAKPLWLAVIYVVSGLLMFIAQGMGMNIV